MKDQPVSFYRWIGTVAVDSHDRRIGRVEQVYLDEPSGRVEWLAIRLGCHDGRLRLAPRSEPGRPGEVLKVPYRRWHVERAPSVDGDLWVETHTVAALHRHYRLRAANPVPVPCNRALDALLPPTPAPLRRYVISH